MTALDATRRSTYRILHHSPGRFWRPGDRGTHTPVSERELHFDAIVLLSFAYCLLPSIVMLLTGGRLAYSAQSTGALIQTQSGLFVQSVVETATPGLLLVSILISIVRGVTRRFAGLILLTVYIMGLIAANYLSLGELSGPSRILPLLIAAIWLVRPQRHYMRIFGFVAFLSAAASLAMIPLSEKAWMAQSAFRIIETKALIGNHLLAGPFPQMNILGMICALGVPCAFFFSHVWLRWVTIPVMSAALILSASRTSMLALVAATVAALVCFAMRRRKGAQALRIAAILGFALFMVILPTVTVDKTSFTGRGTIWIIGLRIFRDNLLYGGGLHIYSPNGGAALSIGEVTWHGHNQYVTQASEAGLVGLFLLFLLWRPLARLAVESLAYLYYFLTLLAVSWAETTLRPDAFDGIAWISWVPTIAAVFLATKATRFSLRNEALHFSNEAYIESRSKVNAGRAELSGSGLRSARRAARMSSS